MRQSTKRLSAVAAMAALSMAGCGSSDPTGPGLDQVASIEIATELMYTVMFLGLGSFNVTSGDAPGAVPANGFRPQFLDTEVISETVPCERGGTITVQGTVTDDISEEGTGSFSMDVRQRPNNCRIETSQGVFTVNGDPDLHVTASWSVTDWFDFGVFSFAYNGGFTWSGPGGSGGCSMNLSYTFNYATQELSYSGSICGYTY